MSGRRQAEFEEARPLFDNVIDLDEDLLDDEEMDDMFRVDLGFSERDLSPDCMVSVPQP